MLQLRPLLVLSTVLFCFSCDSASSVPTTELSSELTSAKFIQVTSSTPQASQTVVASTFPATESAGDLNVVLLGWDDATSAVSSVTDNQNNTYRLAIGPTRLGGTASKSLYYAAMVRGGPTTITVRFSKAAAFVDLTVVEYSGLDPVAPFDVAAGGSGVGTNASTGAFTTQAPSDLIVASDYIQGGTIGPGTSYTQRLITSPDSDIVEDRIAGAAGSYLASAPVSSGWWIMQAAAFKVATGGNGTGAAGRAGLSGSGGAAGAGGGGSGGSSRGAGAGGASGSGSVTGAGTTGGAGAGGASGSGSVTGAGTTGAAGVVGAGGGGRGGGTAGASGGSAGAAGSGGTGAGSGGTGAGSAGSVGTGLFPLAYSANGRYLQSPNGNAFPILGRSSWGVVTLSAADARSYLDDCVAKGFDSIEVGIVWRHSASNGVPFDGAGDVPFLKRLDGGVWSGALSYSNINAEAPDFSTPNPAYWAFVDSFLNDALARGIEVFMFPAYVGYAGEESQGWMQELVANGTTKMAAYGSFIANRYKSQPNIVWMAGGDYGTGSEPFPSTGLAVEQALLSGMHGVAGQRSIFFSAEWNSESIATDQTTFGASMTLNGAYSFQGDVVTQGRRAYSYSPPEPSYLLEEPYDEEGPDGNDVNSAATQPVRRYEWWGWLSTTEGYLAGNGYVWPFNTSPNNWRDHLDTQGAQDLGRLNAFVRSISWWQLVPSGLAGMKTLVTTGGGSGTSVVTASATPTGTTLVAYVPPAHTGSFAIDMTAMSGTSVARWFNPTTAVYTTIGTFANVGTHLFTPPGDNGTGFGDWVLELNKQ